MRSKLETEHTATYWPPVPLSLAALLSCSAGRLNRGSWGPIALCWVLVPTTASYLQLDGLQLTQLPVAPSYIIVWHPPATCEHRICIQFKPSTVKAISWCLRPDAPVSRLICYMIIYVHQFVYHLLFYSSFIYFWLLIIWSHFQLFLIVAIKSEWNSDKIK